LSTIATLAEVIANGLDNQRELKIRVDASNALLERAGTSSMRRLPIRLPKP